MTTQNDTMNVFDRRIVRRRRDRAAPGLDGFDFLFMEGAARLCDRLEDIKRTFSSGLDLGCHGGEVAAALPPGKVDTLIQADLAPNMVTRARQVSGQPGLVCDEEALPLGVGTLDLVMSNLSLHWVNDLPGALSQSRMALKPDGLFLGAIFGGETLHELRDALAAAEIELEGGLSPRVSPFADVRDLGSLLQRAGFALPVVDADTITVSYADPLRLLADLRGMGETNAVIERRKTPLRRATLMSAMTKYMDAHADADGRVPATFQILTMTAWAPAANQQKPLKPGAATGRIADALGVDEVPLGEKADPTGGET